MTSPSPAPARGRFIVFEGTDGSGLTTQAERLKAALAQRGLPVHLTKEPSEGPAGMLIRLALARRLGRHDPDGRFSQLDEATLGLLFAADRMDHLANDVAPKLEQGITVICDRYYLSSYAYQSLGADLAWLRSINARAIPPDLTIFLDVSPEVCKARMERSRWHVEWYEELPKLQRIRQRYLALIDECRQRGEPVAVIPGEAAAADVAAHVLEAVRGLLPTV